MSHNIKRFLNSLYEKQEYSVLSVFRILFGGTLFLEVLQMFSYKQLMFTKNIPSFLSVNIIAFLLLVWMIVLIMLTIGWFTKVVVIANYIFVVGFIGIWAKPNGFDYHSDTVILTVSLFFLFLPISI